MLCCSQTGGAMAFDWRSRSAKYTSVYLKESSLGHCAGWLNNQGETVIAASVKCLGQGAGEAKRAGTSKTKLEPLRTDWIPP